MTTIQGIKIVQCIGIKMLNDRIKMGEKPLMAASVNGQPSNGHSTNSARAPGTNDEKFGTVHIASSKVHQVLERHLLADGLDLVVDLKKSKGSWIEDARSGKRY